MSETIQDKEKMVAFLTGLGARRQRNKPDCYILDKICFDFYLLFDVSDQPENPEDNGTADIYAIETDVCPNDGKRFRLVVDADEVAIAKFLLLVHLPIMPFYRKQELRQLALTDSP